VSCQNKKSYEYYPILSTTGVLAEPSASRVTHTHTQHFVTEDKTNILSYRIAFTRIIHGLCHIEATVRIRRKTRREEVVVILPKKTAMVQVRHCRNPEANVGVGAVEYKKRGVYR